MIRHLPLKSALILAQSFLGLSTLLHAGLPQTISFPSIPDQPVVEMKASPAMAVGSTHTLFLKSDGTAWRSGLDRNTTGGATYTVPTEEMTGVQAIAAGSHSLFVKTDGTAWAMGGNTSGQLGDNSTISRDSPVQVLAGVRTVAASGDHSLFLKEDGSVWATGRNSSGEYGNGTTTASLVPVRVMEGVKAISASGPNSLFLKEDGSVWAAGSNGGNFGNGTTDGSATPVHVMDGVTAISAGLSHSLFLKSDGTAWASGWNSHGQLGIGDAEPRLLPVPVLSGVRAVSASSSHSMFLTNDGTVWAAGNNQWGQLGNGTVENSSSLVRVLIDGVSAIATRTNHSHFLKDDGSFWSAGGNNSGQLGDGTLEQRNTPVRIMEAYLPGRTQPAATASSGLPVTFTIVSGPAILSDGLLVITGEGIITVRAEQAGDSQYDPAAPVTRTFTAARAAQSIAFLQPEDRLYSGPDSLNTKYRLLAESSSGLPISYSILSGPAVVEGSVLTASGPGTITVRASQSGNLAYQPATFAERTFTLRANLAAPSIPVISTDRFMDGSPVGTIIATVTSVDADQDDVVSYSLVSGAGDTDNGLFTIHGNEVRTTATFDFDHQRSASIRVRATDLAGQSSEATFTFSIRDATPSYRFTDARVHTNLPGSIVTASFRLADPSGKGIDLPLEIISDPGFFQIWEDGVPLGPEAHFQVAKSGEIPISVRTVLLIDNSLSMSTRLAATKSAAKSFIDSSPDSHEFVIYTFSETATLLQAATTDKNALRAAIDAIPSTDLLPGTNLHDTLEQALQEWTDSTDLRSPAKRGFAVILTDGVHGTGGRTLEQLIESRGDKSIFTIGLGTGTDPGALSQIGNAGYFHATTTAELPQVFPTIRERIQLDIASFCWVSYISLKRDDQDHTLDISVAENHHWGEGRDFHGIFNSTGFTSEASEVVVNRSILLPHGITSLTQNGPTSTELRATTILPADVENPPAYTWEIENTSIASITGSGDTITLTGISDGTTRLIVTDTVNRPYGSRYRKEIPVMVTGLPPGGFLSWAATAGLRGGDASATATPYHDGVPNLLKFAFNLDGRGPDARSLSQGLNAGLPVISSDTTGARRALRFEYLRRKDGGLQYLPEISIALGGFSPLTGTETIDPIDSRWEKVTVVENPVPEGRTAAFGRLRVVLLPPP